MAGYGEVTIDTTAGVRHGAARDSGAEFGARFRAGEMNGPGIVLKRARGTMAFGEHLRHSAGRLGLVAWLLVGLVAAIAGWSQGLGTIWAYATAGLLAFFAVLRMSLPRAFWHGLTRSLEGLSIVRNFVLPVALPRVGTPPRPIAPPREAGAHAGEGAGEPRPHERDPDEPPPIVRRA